MHDTTPAVMHMATPVPAGDQDWRDRALCRDTDPQRMQPDRPLPADVAKLRERCGGCPVLADCRKLADAHTPYGVWAGVWHGEWEPAGPAEVIGPVHMAVHVESEGLSDAQIGTRYGLHRRAVQRYRVELGLERGAAGRVSA